MKDCEKYTHSAGNKTITFYAKGGNFVAVKTTTVDVSGMVIKIWKNPQNMEHRNDKPAIIHMVGGKIVFEAYCRNGKYYRANDLPAIIGRENGQIICETWYQNGVMHRDDKPADIYYKDGEVVEQIWYKHGKIHRDGQPAIIRLAKGQIVASQWYSNGVLMQNNDIFSAINHIECLLSSIKLELMKK